MTWHNKDQVKFVLDPDNKIFTILTWLMVWLAPPSLIEAAVI